jgi:Fe-S-cluster-containing hydrogenase component 2
MPDHGLGNAGGIGDPSNDPIVTPTMRADACFSVQRPGAPCRKCAEACRADAIRIGARSVELIAEACIGCGSCAAACPTGALSVSGSDVLPGHNPVRLECSRLPASRRGADAQAVACLGGITPADLRRLLANGSDVTLVDRGWCRDCPAGRRPDPWRSTVAQVHRELEALGKDAQKRVRVAHAPLPTAIALAPPAAPSRRSPVMARRQLLLGLSQPRPPARPPLRVDARHSPPAKVATEALIKRRDDLRQLADGEALPGALFPAVAISDTCCDNQVCVSACPTGALRAIDAGNTRGVDFDAALCIACRACESGCPSHSVSVRAEGQGTYAGWIALRRTPQAICRSCRSPYVRKGEETACPACRKDADLARLGHGLMRRRWQADEPFAVTPQNRNAPAAGAAARKTCLQ